MAVSDQNRFQAAVRIARASGAKADWDAAANILSGLGMGDILPALVALEPAARENVRWGATRVLVRAASRRIEFAITAVSDHVLDPPSDDLPRDQLAEARHFLLVQLSPTHSQASNTAFSTMNAAAIRAITEATPVTAALRESIPADMQAQVLTRLAAVESAIASGIDPKLTPFEAEFVRRADLAVVRAAYAAMPSWPHVEPEDLRCSTLFIAGTENSWSMSSVDVYRARLAKCGIEVALLPGASHEAELAPDSKVLDRIEAYLKRASSVEGVHDRLERHASASDSDDAVRPGRERWEPWFERLHQVNHSGNNGSRPVHRGRECMAALPGAPKAGHARPRRRTGSRRSLEPLAGRTDMAVPTKFEGIGFDLYDVASLDFDKEAAIFGAPLPVDVKGLSPRRARFAPRLHHTHRRAPGLGIQGPACVGVAAPPRTLPLVQNSVRLP